MQHPFQNTTAVPASSIDSILFSCFPQPLGIYDRETLEFLAVNDRAMTLYGYTRSEFLTLRVPDLHPAKDWLAAEEHRRHLPQGTAVSGPWRYRRKDGTLFWAETSAHDLLFEGRAARLVAVVDITPQVTAESELHDVQEFSTVVLDTIGALVTVLDTQGCIVRFNKACETLTGYREAEVLGRDFLPLFLLPEEASSVREVFGRLCDGKFPNAFANVWVARDGSRHQIEWTNTALLDEAGQVRFVIATGLDVTERRRTEAALQAAESNYRAMFENALEGIFQTTPDGHYLAANPALAHIYGYETPDELKASMVDLRRQLYVKSQVREEFTQHVREHGFVSGFEAEIMRKDGQTIWISEHARAVCDQEGTLLYYEGMVQDITHRKKLEAERECLLEEAVARADRDPLTGLLNHRAFHKRLEEEADRAQRTGRPLTIAVMDLDHFKFFNDAYGHSVGDEVLIQVAQALCQVCRSYDTLARFGGDEFAMLMPDTPGVKGMALAQRLQASLDSIGYRPPDYDSVIPLGLSIGVATFPDEGTTRLDALSTADTRLRRAKSGTGEDEGAASLRASLTSSLSGFSMLDALVAAVDNKDRYTRHHSEDVMTLCLQMAHEMKLNADQQHTLAVAALLHDVGKIGVPDRILRKPGILTDEEYQAVQQHPTMGATIIGAVEGLEHTLDCVRHHHEHWNGQGYPAGLRGDAIPLLARLMAVADAYSAMTTDRPYRQGKREEQALAILADGAGTQWDPVCVQALCRARRTLANACFSRRA